MAPPPGKRDLVRYREVRRADVLDDQKSALAILDADSSLTQEQLQELLLSQVKRIIWGNDPGHWNDDFVTSGVPALASLSQTFVASCDAAAAIDDLVLITGDPVADVRPVEVVDVHNYTKMPAAGIIIDKDSPVLCRVQTLGPVPLTGLTAGRPCFAGDDGRPTNTPPLPTGTYAMVQPIGYAMDSSTLFLLPSLHYTKLIP